MNCPRESCFKCLVFSWWHYFSVETSEGETKQEEVGLQGWVTEGVLSLSTFGLAHCSMVSPETKSPPPVQSSAAMLISCLSCLPTWPGPCHHEANSWTHEPKWVFSSSSFISAVHYFRGTGSLAPPRTPKTTISLLRVVTLTTTLTRLLFKL